ncbi:MAG: Hsp70 family protein [Planctomycetota bacterium]
MPRTAVGIDLGTTNSLLAFAEGAEDVRVLEGRSGRLLQSCVYVVKGGNIEVGDVARAAAPKEPSRFFEHFKRDMGDPHWERTVDGLKLTPVLLSSFVLRRLVHDAQPRIGPVTDAVITVPAWFGDLERGATLDAARIAGIENARALNEPTAAALAYGLDPATRTEGRRRALVYDLGGGTFDVTIVELEKGRVRVLATAGEKRLGGKDWDDELLNLVAERIYERVAVDPREDERRLTVLRAECERAKIALSESTRAVVKVDLGDSTYETLVTRESLEQRTRGLVDQTETQVELVLEKAKLSWDDIDAVLPVGGATRMPVIRALLWRVSRKEPLTLLHPEEAVARGACTYAALLARGDTLEVDESHERPARRPTPPPPSSHKPPSGTIDVFINDEGEELPLLPGETRVPEVQDVVSHGLGVLVVTAKGRKNVVLIPEQTPVPVKRTRPFFTIRDDQVAVQIKVLEGDGEDPDGCTVLGELLVDGLPPGRPKGQAIEVSYEYDEDGRVQVSARDVATGRAARATIERVGALQGSQIEALKREVARRVGRS